MVYKLIDIKYNQNFKKIIVVLVNYIFISVHMFYLPWMPLLKETQI